MDNDTWPRPPCNRVMNAIVTSVQKHSVQNLCASCPRRTVTHDRLKNNRFVLTNPLFFNYI